MDDIRSHADDAFRVQAGSYRPVASRPYTDVVIGGYDRKLWSTVNTQCVCATSRNEDWPSVIFSVVDKVKVYIRVGLIST